MAGGARSKGLGPVHRGRGRLNPKLCSNKLHLHNRQLLRLLDPRDAVPANLRRHRAIPVAAGRRLHLHAAAVQQPLHHDDDCQRHLHPRRGPAGRPAGLYQVGPPGRVVVVLLPGPRLQHELGHGEQQCRGVYEEAADGCRAVYGVLCWGILSGRRRLRAVRRRGIIRLILHTYILSTSGFARRC